MYNMYNSIKENTLSSQTKIANSEKFVLKPYHTLSVVGSFNYLWVFISPVVVILIAAFFIFKLGDGEAFLKWPFIEFAVYFIFNDIFRYVVAKANGVLV